MERIESIAAIAFSAAVVLQAVAILANPSTYQWDLVAYARGVTRYVAGLNPYDGAATVAALAGSTNAAAAHLPFVYPPVTLPLFRLLFAGGFRAAYVAFLAIKVALLAGCVTAWVRAWVSRRDRALFLLFAIVAFNGCLTTDLAAGNVALYEAFFVAVGFVLFARGELVGFAACVLAASVFKLTPLLLLAPLPFVRGDARGRGVADGRVVFAVAGGVVVVAAAAAYALAPDLHRAFVGAAFSLTDSGGERAFQNPSARALFADGARLVGAGASADVTGLGGVLYVAWAAFVVVATGFRLRRIASSRAAALTLTCLAYAVVLPRFKDYAYVLVLAPFMASLEGRSLRVRIALVALAIFPGDALARALSDTAATHCPVTPAWLALAYLPLLTVTVAWALKDESSTSRVTGSGPAVNLAG